MLMKTTPFRGKSARKVERQVAHKPLIVSRPPRPKLQNAWHLFLASFQASFQDNLMQDYEAC